MLATQTARLGSLVCLALFTGCRMVPKSHLDAAESQNRALVEQNNSLLAENENLRMHGRRLEEQVKQAEEELAEMEQRSGPRQR